ncbi:nucleoside deaminase [Taibaiella soli]|uniref:Nucleoside deaminase n=2 Tax=Taibaiella soli TaxID=1649169 RepID=A0A2W2BA42_9BACT|nr:nucleoside deaminase [Taibaiella soli]
MQEQYEHHMRQCLSLAREALAAGNPPVGALLVYEGQIIGTGIESGKSTGDITNHAEILAIRDAINKGYSDKLSKACMYTTHEPCIMCSYVIRHHHIPELLYGISVTYVGGFTSVFEILSTAEIPNWGSAPKITNDICVDECAALNEEFQRRLNK